MRLISSFLLSFLSLFLQGQTPPIEYRTILDGQEVTIIVFNGDTTIIAELEKAIVKPAPELIDEAERQRYLKYRRYAPIVYPYAVHAVRLYNQLQRETEGKSASEKRKLVKSISRALEEEFEKPLKNLTKTQGFLLTKMLERELNKPFYEIIKELKGGFTAYYWNKLGKINGYDLKEKYNYGEDALLDSILDEYDLSKDLEANGK